MSGDLFYMSVLSSGVTIPVNEDALAAGKAAKKRQNRNKHVKVSAAARHGY